MIVDSLKNASLYYSICPRMEQAFELISKLDLETLETGKHELDGDNIFVNIAEGDLKDPSNAKLEIHNTYADIQILISGEKEGFGWCERALLSSPIDEFNEAKDIQFYADAYQMTYYTHKGQFTIFMPEDGHAPMIGNGKIKKAIVKVRI